EVDALLAQVAEWAAQRDDVRGVILVGSTARTDHPADEWSDVDLILAVDDTATFLDAVDWLEPFGRVLATMVEPTAVGGFQERRVLFATGLDVDFSIVPAELVALLPELAHDPQVRATVGHGARVLHDELGIGHLLASIDPPAPAGPPSEQAYRQLSNTFWYDAVWTAKKVRRGELWVAKHSCDGQLLRGLVEVLRWRTQLRHPGRETWHGLRFAEEWLDPDDAALLSSAATTADPAGVGRALGALVDGFAAVESEVAAAVGCDVAVPVDELRSLIAATLPPADET
ncbi:hypothetical protein B7486_62490, partial [cyanobacterium TDX16]